MQIFSWLSVWNKLLIGRPRKQKGLITRGWSFCAQRQSCVHEMIILGRYQLLMISYGAKSREIFKKTAFTVWSLSFCLTGITLTSFLEPWPLSTLSIVTIYIYIYLWQKIRTIKFVFYLKLIFSDLVLSWSHVSINSFPLNAKLFLCETSFFAESMILLGSIERTELQALLDWWLSPQRRVFERGQSSPGQASKISWESFTFVDEEGGEESPDKVEKCDLFLTIRCCLFVSATPLLTALCPSDHHSCAGRM